MPSQPVTHGCVDLAGKRLTAAQNDEFEVRLFCRGGRDPSYRL
jgi:hypothetical protein